MICSRCQIDLNKDELKSGGIVVVEGKNYCKSCGSEASVLPDAVLVDVNENFDTTAVVMVEKMDLEGLNEIDTGTAASISSDTNTATVSIEDLDLDNEE